MHIKTSSFPTQLEASFNIQSCLKLSIQLKDIFSHFQTLIPRPLDLIPEQPCSCYPTTIQSVVTDLSASSPSPNHSIHRTQLQSTVSTRLNIAVLKNF